MELVLTQVMISCLNIPYVWGGANPLTGLDCSGFVIWCLQSVGLWGKGDTTAQGLYAHFKISGQLLDKEAVDIPVGTLVFFGSSVSTITHVGMYIDDDIMIEAGGGGSNTKTPDDAKKSGACVRARPINSRRDLVALVSPWKQPVAAR